MLVKKSLVGRILPLLFLVGCKVPLPEVELPPIERTYSAAFTGGTVGIREVDQFARPKDEVLKNRVLYFDGWKVNETFKIAISTKSLFITNKSPRDFNDITIKLVLEDGTELTNTFKASKFKHYEITPLSTTAIQPSASSATLLPADQAEIDTIQPIKWIVRDMSSKLPSDPDTKFHVRITAEYAQHYAEFMYNYALLFGSKEFKEYFLALDTMVIGSGKNQSTVYPQDSAVTPTQLSNYQSTFERSGGNLYEPTPATEPNRDDILQIGLRGNLKTYTIGGVPRAGKPVLSALAVYQDYVGKEKGIDLRLFSNSASVGLGGGFLISVHENLLQQWINSRSKNVLPSSMFLVFFHEMGHWIGYNHSSNLTYGIDRAVGRWMRKKPEAQTGFYREYPKLESLENFPYLITERF